MIVNPVIHILECNEVVATFQLKNTHSTVVQFSTEIVTRGSVKIFNKFSVISIA